MDLDVKLAPSTVSIEEALRYAAVFALLALALLVIGGGLLMAALGFLWEDELLPGLIVGFVALLVLLLGSIALCYKFLVDAVGRGVDGTTESVDTDTEASGTREN